MQVVSWKLAMKKVLFMFSILYISLILRRLLLYKRYALILIGLVLVLIMVLLTMLIRNVHVLMVLGSLVNVPWRWITLKKIVRLELKRTNCLCILLFMNLWMIIIFPLTLLQILLRPRLFIISQNVVLLLDLLLHLIFLLLTVGSGVVLVSARLLGFMTFLVKKTYMISLRISTGICMKVNLLLLLMILNLMKVICLSILRNGVSKRLLLLRTSMVFIVVFVLNILLLRVTMPLKRFGLVLVSMNLFCVVLLLCTGLTPITPLVTLTMFMFPNPYLVTRRGFREIFRIRGLR